MFRAGALTEQPIKMMSYGIRFRVHVHILCIFTTHFSVHVCLLQYCTCMPGLLYSTCNAWTTVLRSPSLNDTSTEFL